MLQYQRCARLPCRRLIPWSHRHGISERRWRFSSWKKGRRPRSWRPSTKLCAMLTRRPSESLPRASTRRRKLRPGCLQLKAQSQPRLCRLQSRRPLEKRRQSAKGSSKTRSAWKRPRRVCASRCRRSTQWQASSRRRSSNPNPDLMQQKVNVAPSFRPLCLRMLLTQTRPCAGKSSLLGRWSCSSRAEQVLPRLRWRRSAAVWSS
mmetsp:Transcript_111054/g.265072  ORF Transcript_111054/g.265072 Transcript_111054/m.265072 type:complete len:205 (+) Transcript_111054:2753-3367(+)